jgi:hypothetical protein
VSTAEKIFQTAQRLPEQAQDALLHMAELLAAKSNITNATGKPQFGSARGLIKMSADFDEPLDDLKPYTE